MHIERIYATPEHISKTLQTSKNQVENHFDAILDATTTIYAQPASAPSSTASSNTDTTTDFDNDLIPESMQSIFSEAAQLFNISEQLLRAVAKAESDYDPTCTSIVGAMGIMQLMPDTANELGVDNPYDVRENIMGGAKLLSNLLAKYNGNTSLALAAYNAGSGNVDKYGGIPPFDETQHYVEKILGFLGQSTPDTTAVASAPIPPTEVAPGTYAIKAVPSTQIL